MDAYCISEQAPARRLFPLLRQGMLCLADRNFFSWRAWQQARRRGADRQCRLKKDHLTHRRRVLEDGSYLTTAHPSSRDRRRGVPVRVVERSLPGVEATAPVCRLETTILDPQAAPAHDLAVPCHERWEAETACSEVKVHLPQRLRCWRGQSPVTVRQERCGLLLAHSVVRGVRIEAAAQARLDPDRLSFPHCLRVLRRQLPNYAMLAQRRRKLVYRRMLNELLDEVYGPRPRCRDPRVVKRKYDSLPVQRNQPTFTPIPDISKHVHVLKLAVLVVGLGAASGAGHVSLDGDVVTGRRPNQGPKGLRIRCPELLRTARFAGRGIRKLDGTRLGQHHEQGGHGDRSHFWSSHWWLGWASLADRAGGRWLLERARARFPPMPRPE